MKAPRQILRMPKLWIADGPTELTKKSAFVTAQQFINNKRQKRLNGSNFPFYA